MHRVVLFINPKPAAGHAQTRRGQTGNAKPVLCLVPSHGKGVEELPKNLLILSREPTQCSFSSLDKCWNTGSMIITPLTLWQKNHFGHWRHYRAVVTIFAIVTIVAMIVIIDLSATPLTLWQTKHGVLNSLIAPTSSSSGVRPESNKTLLDDLARSGGYKTVLSIYGEVNRYGMQHLGQAVPRHLWLEHLMI